MCGFAGFITNQISPFSGQERLLRDMGKAISHRGPDDSGVWSSVGGQVGLVHQRLSILDLSSS